MRDKIHGTPDDWFAWLRGANEKRRDRAKLILGSLTPDDPVRPEPLIARLTDSNEDNVFSAVIGLTQDPEPLVRNQVEITLRDIRLHGRASGARTDV